MGSLDALRVKLRRRAESTQRAAAQRTVADLVRAAPKDTRQLSKSVRIGAPQSGTAKVSSRLDINPSRTPSRPNNVAVAAFNEFGTAPHVIRPRRAKALRFSTGGRVVYARVVHHPGQPARPWWYPTVNRWGRNVREAWRGRT